MNNFSAAPNPAGQNQPCYGCSPDMTAFPQIPQGQPNLAATLPTGFPTGPVYAPSPAAPGAMPSNQPPQRNLTPSDLAPITALNQPMPVTTQSLQYINGFLRTQIGKRVTVEFLIGTNTLVDRTGTLLGVGANYILINEIETDDVVVCDFFSIKFVRVYY